eukprot:5775-Pleurochrysis_carterae.AAC.5
MAVSPAVADSKCLLTVALRIICMLEHKPKPNMANYGRRSLAVASIDSVYKHLHESHEHAIQLARRRMKQRAAENGTDFVF